MTLTDERTGTEERTGVMDTARRAMIDSQLRTSGVNQPRILAAMAGLAREDFVPAALRSTCYVDRAIPLGSGRFLAAPLVHARMLAEAAPQTSDKALLITSGSDYLAALLRPLVGTLDSVDVAGVAAKRPKGGYSLIVVDGAAEELPESLVKALADDGRIVTGLVERGVTRLAIGRKALGQLALLAVAEIGIPVLPELAAPKRWSF